MPETNVTKEEVLVEIIVDDDEAFKAIAASRKAIDELKQSSKDLDKQRKESRITEQDYYQLKTRIANALQNESEKLRANEKELRNNQKQTKDNTGSLVALRAELSNITKQYDNLSRADRESDVGTNLLKNLNEVATELNTVEQASQRFQRNVGNYPKIDVATASLRELKNELKDLRDAQAQAATSKDFNELANSINKVEGRISSLNNEFKTTIGNNAERTKAGLNLIQEGITNLDFDKIKIGLGGVKISALAASVGMAALTSAMTLGIGAILQMLPSLSDLWKMFTGVAAAEIEAERNLRNYNSQLEFSKILEDKRVSAQENFIKINNAIGKDTLENEKIILQAKTEAIDKELELNGKRIIDLEKLKEKEGTLSDEQQEELMKRIDDITAFNEKRNKLQNDFDAEQEVKRIENNKERLQKEKDALQKLQDAQIALLNEGADKQIKVLQTQTDREIQQIKERLSKEHNLSIEARTYLNETIVDLRKKLAIDIDKVNKEQRDKDIEELKLFYSNVIELAEKGSKKELDAKQNVLEQERQQRVNSAKETGESVEQINQIYLKRSQDLTQEYYDNLAKSRADYLRENFRSVSDIENIEFKSNERKLDNTEKYYDAVIEFTKQKSFRLQSLSEEEIKAIYGSNAEAQIQYRADVELSKQAVIDAETAKQVAAQQTNQVILNGIQNVSNAVNASIQAEIDIRNKKFDEETASMDNMKKSQIKALQEDLKNKKLTDQQKIDLQKRIDEAQKQLDDQDKKRASERQNRTAALVESQKALAFFQVGLDSAKAISAATVAVLTDTTTPSLVLKAAALIGVLATIAGSIANARSTISGLSNPDVPQFERGGAILGGEQTIRVNEKGIESVNNARSTAMFSPILSAFNQMGGGSSFNTADSNAQLQGEEMIARAVLKGVKAMPNPIVSWKDWYDTNKKVGVIQDLP